MTANLKTDTKTPIPPARIWVPVALAIFFVIFRPLLAQGQERSSWEDPFKPKPAQTFMLAQGTSIAPATAFEAEVARAEKELQGRTRTEVDLLATGFTDANDMTYLQYGLGGRFHLFNAVDLKARAFYGSVGQDADALRIESEVDLATFELALENFYATPQVVLWGAVTYEDFSRNDDSWATLADGTRFTRPEDERGYLWGGRAGAKYIFPKGSDMGLELRRESFWAREKRYNIRQYNRVVDMSRMPTDMYIDKISGWANLKLFPENELRLNAGYQGYEDNNQVVWGYAHYQIPVLDSSPQRWTVVRPNLYAESVEDEHPAYFSPDVHVALGLGLHTIRQFDTVDLEFEVNPLLLWTEGLGYDNNAYPGISGVAKLIYKLRHWHLGLALFGYADSEDYDMIHLSLFISYLQ